MPPQRNPNVLYAPKEGPYEVVGSCRRPGEMHGAARVTTGVAEEVVGTTTEGFGVHLESSNALPLNRLRFAWRRSAYSGITVREMLSRSSLYRDLFRVR